MRLSDHNLLALLLEIHKNIENDTKAAVNIIFSESVDNLLAYPPGIEFTDAERDELRRLNDNPALRRALRKLLASHAAEAIFSLFSLIDGTIDPTHADWSGIRLVDDHGDDYREMLHDRFLETYWDWEQPIK